MLDPARNKRWWEDRPRCGKTSVCAGPPTTRSRVWRCQRQNAARHQWTKSRPIRKNGPIRKSNSVFAHLNGQPWPGLARREPHGSRVQPTPPSQGSVVEGASNGQVSSQECPAQNKSSTMASMKSRSRVQQWTRGVHSGNSSSVWNCKPSIRGFARCALKPTQRIGQPALSVNALRGRVREIELKMSKMSGSGGRAQSVWSGLVCSRFDPGRY